MATSESPRRKNPQRKAGIRSLEARRTASQQRLREEEEDGAASVDHSGDGSDASDLSWQLGSDSSTDDEIDTGAGIDEILREIVPERPGGRGSPKRDRSDRGKNESASTNAKIQETYRVLSKEDQFAKAASLADVGALSPEQLATREGYIRVVSESASSCFFFLLGILFAVRLPSPTSWAGDSDRTVRPLRALRRIFLRVPPSARRFLAARSDRVFRFGTSTEPRRCSPLGCVSNLTAGKIWTGLLPITCTTPLRSR